MQQPTAARPAAISARFSNVQPRTARSTARMPKDSRMAQAVTTARGSMKLKLSSGIRTSREIVTVVNCAVQKMRITATAIRPKTRLLRPSGAAPARPFVGRSRSFGGRRAVRREWDVAHDMMHSSGGRSAYDRR